MANEVQRPNEDLAGPATGSGAQPDGVAEDDPKTWYGLVWRIVRAAMESDAKLIRICVLLALVLVLIAVIGAAWLGVGVMR